MVRCTLIGLLMATMPALCAATEMPRHPADEPNTIRSVSTKSDKAFDGYIGRFGRVEGAAPPRRERPLPELFKLLDIGAAPFPADPQYAVFAECVPGGLLRAVDKALAQARTGLSVRVTLPANCTYRESLTIRGPIAGSIEIAAAVSGATIISGSDIFSGWTRTGEIWWNRWPLDFGLTWPSSWPARLPQNVVLKRTETFFVNGNRLRQVGSRNDLEAQTFYIDEKNDRVFIWTPIDLSHARVEGTVRRRPVVLRSTNNVAIRGIVVQHGASAITRGAIAVMDSRNILFEDLTVRENSGKGLQIAKSKFVTVRRARLHDNGYNCFGAYKTVGLLSEDIACLRSNWRGYPYGMVGWDPAGAKFVRLHDAIFRRFVSKGNFARGFWLDYDIKNILIDDSEWSDNKEKDGAFFEKVIGPVIVRGLTVRNNKETGIKVSAARDITIQDSHFEGNAVQIRFSGARNVRVVDFETGEVHTLNTDKWVLTRNVFSATRKEVIANGSKPPPRIRATDNFCRTVTKSPVDRIVCK